jgi:hypothetical protein
MTIPRTQDEFLDHVDQAIFELEDIIMCAQDEGDPEDHEFSDIMPVYEHLSKELKQLHVNVMQGQHAIGQGEDLPLMFVAAKWKERIPFYDLLTALNHAYKTGFQA